MQTSLIYITTNVRKFLRPRLSKHSKLHQLSIKLHRKYCSLTGNLHVLPDFYVIGAAKSGTSSLYEYIIQHPSIQPAVTKETHFFDRYYDRGINWYRVCFPFKSHKFIVKNLNKKKFITGEATPRYIDHPQAPKRIKELTPNAKFFVLLRNPIDRAYSQYNMNSRGDAETLSFEEAIKQETERTQGEYKKMEDDENYYSRPYFKYSYLERGIYVNKLQRWMKYFSKEQFLVIKSEDMLKKPNETYQQIVKFLNLAPWVLKEYKQYRAASYKKTLMNPETRKQLRDFFKPHNEKLYKFLGKNFEWD